MSRRRRELLNLDFGDDAESLTYTPYISQMQQEYLDVWRSTFAASNVVVESTPQTGASIFHRAATLDDYLVHTNHQPAQTAQISKYIRYVGLELEGGFRPHVWANGRDIGVMAGDNSVKLPPEMRHVLVAGEARVGPSNLADIKDLIDRWMPEYQNQTCGTHIHVSFNNNRYYDLLSTKVFYRHFMDKCNAYIGGNDAIPKNLRDEYNARARGFNTYCCPNYWLCSHAQSEREPCDHRCTAATGCLDTRHCRHRCDDRNTRSYARARRDYPEEYPNPFCLESICTHDCEGDCGVDEDGDECCVHDCDDSFDQCYRRSEECFHVHSSSCCPRNCVHVHNVTEDCQRIVWQAGPDGIHTPEMQRFLKNKEAPRYAHLNFCESIHNTMEIRLFPALYTAEFTYKTVEFVCSVIDEYIATQEKLKEIMVPQYTYQFIEVEEDQCA